MPIYEFRCHECGAVFEERRSAAALDEAPPPCPDGHPSTRRILSVFAAVGSSPRQGAAGGASPAGGCGAGCACAANS